VCHGFSFFVIREGRRQIRQSDLAICIDIEVKGLRQLTVPNGSGWAKRSKNIVAT
jgi:hypothetical protein